MDPGNGMARFCFRGAEADEGGSGYATEPRGAAIEPRCECGWEPTDPRNGVLLDA